MDGMAASTESAVAGSQATSGQVAAVKTPRSLAIGAKGVSTAGDFASMMSALMSDLIDGSVTPGVGHAVCNAGGKLLRVVELEHRYGSREAEPQQPRRTLVLAPPEPAQ
jgi:hypothetical protein